MDSFGHFLPGFWNHALEQCKYVIHTNNLLAAILVHTLVDWTWKLFLQG